MCLFSRREKSESSVPEVFDLPEGFTVTAHSGSMGLPDNSIEAMEAGVRAGAAIVEFDLRFTKEGEPVLSHDAPRGKCATLGDAFAFLAAHPHVLANVDMKTTAFLEKIAPMASAAGVLPQLFYTGVEYEYVDAVRAKSPEIPFYLNSHKIRDDASETVAAYCERVGAVGINLHFNDITPEQAAFFHRRGLKVSIYTPTEEAEILKALRCLPDNITSRRPDLALRLARGQAAD